MQREHDQLIGKLKRQLVVIAQRPVYHSANRVVRGTRKFSGQARANTRLSIGQQNLRVRLAPVYARNAITGELAERDQSFDRNSARIRLGDTAFVSNNLRYIRNVEYQLGDLMYNRAAQAWPQDVRKGVRESRRVLN